jgi:hypothetical protein
VKPDLAHAGVQAIPDHGLGPGGRDEQECPFDRGRDISDTGKARPPVHRGDFGVDRDHLDAALPERGVQDPAEVPGVPGESDDGDPPRRQEIPGKGERIRRFWTLRLGALGHGPFIHPSSKILSARPGGAP